MKGRLPEHVTKKTLTQQFSPGHKTGKGTPRRHTLVKLSSPPGPLYPSSNERNNFNHLARNSGLQVLQLPCSSKTNTSSISSTMDSSRFHLPRHTLHHLINSVATLTIKDSCLSMKDSLPMEFHLFSLVPLLSCPACVHC